MVFRWYKPDRYHYEVSTALWRKTLLLIVLNQNYIRCFIGISRVWQYPDQLCCIHLDRAHCGIELARKIWGGIIKEILIVLIQTIIHLKNFHIHRFLCLIIIQWFGIKSKISIKPFPYKLIFSNHHTRSLLIFCHPKYY